MQGVSVPVASQRILFFRVGSTVQVPANAIDPMMMEIAFKFAPSSFSGRAVPTGTGKGRLWSDPLSAAGNPDFLLCERQSSDEEVKPMRPERQARPWHQQCLVVSHQPPREGVLDTLVDTCVRDAMIGYPREVVTVFDLFHILRLSRMHWFRMYICVRS
jgi:hypothetical protein